MTTPSTLRKPLVYIAGPFSWGDHALNVNRAARCWRRLHDTGIVTPLCPHWSMTQQLIDPMPTEAWYAYDIELLLRCDAVLRLSGPSEGADREQKIAESRGIPVFIDERELVAWARPLALGGVG